MKRVLIRPERASSYCMVHMFSPFATIIRKSLHNFFGLWLVLVERFQNLQNM